MTRHIAPLLAHVLQHSDHDMGFEGENDDELFVGELADDLKVIFVQMNDAERRRNQYRAHTPRWRRYQYLYDTLCECLYSSIERDFPHIDHKTHSFRIGCGFRVYAYPDPD